MTENGISFTAQSGAASGSRPTRSLHTFAQLLRFLLVGLKSNITYYGLYAAFTALGLGVKQAATLVFAIGILYSFLFNKAFVFRGSAAPRAALLRYTLVYIAAWAINMLCLELFVGRLHFRHHIVQAVLVAVIGFGIFVALKLFVFRDLRSCSARASPVRKKHQGKRWSQFGSLARRTSFTAAGRTPEQGDAAPHLIPRAGQTAAGEWREPRMQPGSDADSP